MAGSCLLVMGALLIAPVLPRMQRHFATVPGVEALVALALTAPALSLALLAPFASVIVARLGRKRLLVVATVLYAVFGTTPLPGIIASRSLVGVTEAAILTCCTSCSHRATGAASSERTSKAATGSAPSSPPTTRSPPTAPSAPSATLRPFAQASTRTGRTCPPPCDRLNALLSRAVVEAVVTDFWSACNNSAVTHISR